MKRYITFFFLLIFLVPSFVFAVSDAKINGQKEITITQLPIDIVFTCDLAQAGNKLAFEYYIDMDGNGEVGAMEEIMEFFYITDGIGWIRDPENPESFFAGDETGVDGKLKTTFHFSAEEVFMPEGLTGILKLVDEDGTTDMVKIHIQIEPQPPFIQGKVTDKNTGAAINNVFVMAISDEENYFGITDDNGNYKISVTNGTYKMFAMEFPSTTYQVSDTVTVTVSNNQTQTQDFQLEPYSAFVTGKLTLQTGSPVSGILVMAMGGLQTDPFVSMAISDDQGNYTIGVKPGKVAVSASYLFNMGNENWPADHYVDPAADTVMVADGQTITSNFVFKPYHSFVSGKCTVNGVGLAGVHITGISFDFTTFTMNYYQAFSDENGDYKMGVLAGTLTTLTAEKEGYQLTSPVGGYMQINIPPGQTVSGKDFEFELSGTVTTIAGTVTFSNGSAAPDVYVAAENNFEESPDGFLIAYTDNNGNFTFSNVLEGDYQLGVYKEGYSSSPAMRYFYLSWGDVLTGQDFVLSEGTGVETMDKVLKPKTINLTQNYPNPFNPTTTIQFDLPQAADVEINIYNATGQRIRTLIDGNLSAGHHQVEWDGRNDFGQKVSSGIYFYQMKTDNYNKVMKMILAK